MNRASFRSRYALPSLITLAGSVAVFACGSSTDSSLGAASGSGNTGAAGRTASGGASNSAGAAAGGATSAGASAGGASGSSNTAGASTAGGPAGGAGVGGAASAGTSAGGAGTGGMHTGGASAGGVGGAAGHAGAAGGGGAGAGGGGTAGSAGSGGGAGFATWPGGNSVAIVDGSDVFGMNLSGLFYEPAAGATPAVLWAIRNGPSTLYRLLWNGSIWTPDTANKWGSGKTLEFGNAKGEPDSEGVTKAAFGSTGVYVSIERDNDDANTSRLSVLLIDSSVAPATIAATTEWNLTKDLPSVDPNLGLEAIAWVPDSYLTSKGFIDESTHAAYDPTRYANHQGGIFFVGLEANGMIYGYALNHADSSFQRVATVASGNPGIMDLSFDRDTGYLWAVCDDTCKGRTNVLTIDSRAGSASQGKFVILQGFERPSSMDNLNNEGFTVTTESTCQAGFKSVFYSDDSDDDKHAIRRDSIPCGAFLRML